MRGLPPQDEHRFQPNLNEIAPLSRQDLARRQARGTWMKRYRAIAEYYDAENARHAMLEHDVPFFLGQLPKTRSQSILELAAGTGRAAIPLAQAGHRVVAVDYADDMLAIARRKRDAVGVTE